MLGEESDTSLDDRGQEISPTAITPYGAHVGVTGTIYQLTEHDVFIFASGGTGANRLTSPGFKGKAFRPPSSYQPTFLISPSPTKSLRH
jgi:hypothetical protein